MKNSTKATFVSRPPAERIRHRADRRWRQPEPWPAVASRHCAPQQPTRPSSFSTRQPARSTRAPSRQIEKGMARLMEGRIAHRLSTVRNAKVILVLRGGKILERGATTNWLSKRDAIINCIPDSLNCRKIFPRIHESAADKNRRWRCFSGREKLFLLISSYTLSATNP